MPKRMATPSHRNGSFKTKATADRFWCGFCLERLRDLACEGSMEAVLIYSPDRLSRKYAYQVLLMEEFARHGVEILFIHSPAASTPEEQLLVQLQGMIAEYERAQIAERTRRG